MSERHDIVALTDFARDLFVAAGVEPRLAVPLGTYLVMADAMGHSTHGLALAGWYLDHIAAGLVAREGDPEVVSDRGAAIAWEGRRLPGAFLAEQAMLTAIDRAGTHGTCTLVIGNAHHIGALAAYLELATSRGLLAMIASSSPSGTQVAPFGGLTGVFAPDPVAWGIPTGGEPILIDLSASITTGNMCKRLAAEGRVFERDWLMDADGTPTRDPTVLDRGGTLLPAGGLDHGQKGYGMALAVEALTQGLAGYGRADRPKGTNSAVTVQVHDPDAFGGRERFLRQTGWLAAACLASRPHPGFGRVRLPGQAAPARRRKSEAEGVELYPGVMDELATRAAALGVAVPDPLDTSKEATRP